MSTRPVSTLRHFVDAHLNLDEIKLLCRDLGLDFEHLEYSTKPIAIGSLIDWLCRRGRIHELRDWLLANRPAFAAKINEIPWAAVCGGAAAQPGDPYARLPLGSSEAELAYTLGLARCERPWLLVYDNADRIEPRELAPFLPAGPTGCG